MASPFLSPGLLTEEHTLASLHLKRDHSLPTVLKTVVSSLEDAGYAEGVVTNTRFGSFPHSTIIGLPWGSQVRASQVDTGTRGRRVQPSVRKRKADAISDDAGDGPDGSGLSIKEAVTASSGFLHVLPPTPENWTTSLPHRTQVVYTPDYSYILHRIRARPGSVLIEAGSGSGSFTHAAARAVFNAYPDEQSSVVPERGHSKPGRGMVYTYEFHAERHMRVAQEMTDHGLNTIVRATHRDVYREGFLVSMDESSDLAVSPSATAVFLDLPAPWEALPHLTRRSIEGSVSALDPERAVHICTFSPCVEQAQRTISALRRHGWLDIDMVEMLQKRIEVRREYTGLQYDGMRGVNAVAVNVDEALAKLRDVETRARDFHSGQKAKAQSKDLAMDLQTQEARQALFRDGRLIHRSEPELKTHTSYLVFAILPRQWTDADEEQARSKLSGIIATPSHTPKSQRQLKKESKQRSKGIRQTNGTEDNGTQAS